jgi:hypothetical protein
LLAYALVGTSRPLGVSSTSTISILTAGALVDTGTAGDPGRAAATAALLVLGAANLGAAEQPPPRVVLLDLGAANDVEVIALEQLERLAEDLHEHGLALWLAVPSQRPQEVIGRAAQLLGRASPTTDSGRLGVRVFPRLEDAVAAVEAQTQPGPGR